MIVEEETIISELTTTREMMAPSFGFDTVKFDPALNAMSPKRNIKAPKVAC